MIDEYPPNPIKQIWRAFGEWAWRRRWRGSWKKRAIAAEAVARELRNQVTDGVAESYDRGWQAGWAEAIKYVSEYEPTRFATNPE
jgi:hypothetical protein